LEGFCFADVFPVFEGLFPAGAAFVVDFCAHFVLGGDALGRELRRGGWKRRSGFKE
jgi:hypothetical protein